MSIEAITRVMAHSKAKGTDRVILLIIAEHDGPGGAWPGIDKIARWANVTERPVHYALKRLGEMGELRISHNAGGGSSTREDRRPNRYTILVQCPPNCDKTDRHGVLSTTSRGAVHSTNGVLSTAPEPSLEPEEEPSSSIRRFAESTDDEEDDGRSIPDRGHYAFAAKASIDEQGVRLLAHRFMEDYPNRTRPAAAFNRYLQVAADVMSWGDYTTLADAVDAIADAYRDDPHDSYVTGRNLNPAGDSPW